MFKAPVVYISKKLMFAILCLLTTGAISFYSFALSPIPSDYVVDKSNMEILPISMGVSGTRVNSFAYIINVNGTVSPVNVFQPFVTQSNNVNIYSKMVNFGNYPVTDFRFNFSAPSQDANNRYFVAVIKLPSFVPSSYAAGVPISASMVDNLYAATATYNSSNIEAYCEYDSNSNLLYIYFKDPFTTSTSVVINMPFSSFTGSYLLEFETSYYASTSPVVAPPPPSHDEIVEEALSAINAAIGRVTSQLRNLQSGFQSSIDWLAYNVTNNESGLAVGSTKSISVTSIDDEGEEYTTSKSFVYPSYIQNDYVIENEAVTINQSDRAGTFLGIVHRKFNEIIDLFRLQCAVWFQWWYPLKASTPQYWQVYNSDTGDYEMVSPAGVTAYITWYLGKLYEHLTADIDSVLEQPVEDAQNAISALEQSEAQIKNTYLPAVNSFLPDASDIGSLSAVSYFGNYLQRIFVALGAFNIPIIAALTLAVCMQLIGYFKYKND